MLNADISPVVSILATCCQGLVHRRICRLRSGQMASAADALWRRLPKPSMEGTVKKSISWIAIGFAAAMLSMQPRIVEAAEIKVLCAEAMKPVFEEIARDFERTSGDKVTATYSTAGVI